MYVCVVCPCVLWHAYGGQRVAWGSQFSLSTVSFTELNSGYQAGIKGLYSLSCAPGPWLFFCTPWLLSVMRLDFIKMWYQVSVKKRAKIWIPWPLASTPGVLPMSFVSIPIKDQFAPNMALECAMCHTPHLSCLCAHTERGEVDATINSFFSWRKKNHRSIPPLRCHTAYKDQNNVPINLWFMDGNMKTYL